MMLTRFAHKKVGLLGAGVENLALIPHLQEAGAVITVCDLHDEVDVRARVSNPAVAVRAGKNYLSRLDEFDIVFRIPGMPVRDLRAAIASLNKKPEVTSAINLFLQVRPCPVIGVTGTKGKGTTSTLIAALLEQVNDSVFVGANINRPVFEFFNELTPKSLVVLELSSFQLEDLTESPDIAVILPITEDHLQPQSKENPNYHATLKEYVEAKGNITAYQQPDDLLVFAADSPSSLSIAEQSQARRIGVGRGPNADISVSNDGKITVNGSQLVDLQEIGLRGEHIFLDAALAVAVGREFDVTIDQVKTAFASYKPLPHRLQMVTEIKGVKFFDDSYATAPDASMAAIKAFTEPVIWIAGGVIRGASFNGLAISAKQSTVKHVILFGEDGPVIEKALLAVGFDRPVSYVKNMKESVGLATSLAKSGDVVLLSPAAKSYDMFKNAADRGEQFTKLVLEGKNGVAL